MHFWWPPRVDDVFHYDWGESGQMVISVVDVLDPLRRLKNGYILEATVLKDQPIGSCVRFILGGTIIMRYQDLVELGCISLMSRRIIR